MGRESRHIPVNLGYKLKKIRKGLKKSQSGMLKILKRHLENPRNGILKRLEILSADNLFRSSVSGYELGLRMPPYYVIMAYAEIANVYLEVLYDDTVKLSDFDRLPYEEKDQGIHGLFIDRHSEKSAEKKEEDDSDEEFDEDDYI